MTRRYTKAPERGLQRRLNRYMSAGSSHRLLVAAADFLGVEPSDLLPRKDSNLQPAGYRSALVVAA